jgi:hypothetical protein
MDDGATDLKTSVHVKDVGYGGTPKRGNGLIHHTQDDSTIMHGRILAFPCA